MRDKRKTLDKKRENLKFKKIAKKQKQQERGITLIELVITIIILLILSGVTLNIALTDGGLFSKTKKTTEEYKTTTVDEQRQIAMLEAAINLNGTEYKSTYNSKEVTVPIPAGFAVSEVEGENTVEDGLVIIDSKGNEFVWIPCTTDGINDTIKYNRYIYLDNQAEEGRDEESESIQIKVTFPSGSHTFVEKLPEDEYESVNIYKGYYIARYEAGCDTQRTNESDALREVLIKPNCYVYNFVNYENSELLANNMSKENNYKNSFTKLCSSYSWDTALKFIEQKNSEYIKDSKGGNYNTDTLVKTGITKSVNNIYDLGGNGVEYTSERTKNKDFPITTRGGAYGDKSETYPAGFRNGASSEAKVGRTFRITMFIK